MKKLLVMITVSMFGLTPLYAFADAITPIQPTIEQLWARIAEVDALIVAAQSSSPVSCTATTSVPTVKVNTPFILAWGSVGAMLPGSSTTQSMWQPAGAQTVTQTKAGTWKYSFDFYSPTGATTSCDATIKVTAE